MGNQEKICKRVVDKTMAEMGGQSVTQEGGVDARWVGSSASLTRRPTRAGGMGGLGGWSEEEKEDSGYNSRQGAGAANSVQAPMIAYSQPRHRHLGSDLSDESGGEDSGSEVLRTALNGRTPAELQDNRTLESFHEKRRRMNQKKRVVLKGGMTNVSYKNISKKKRRYFSDLYTTLLDSSWSYCVVMFTTSFYGSWIIFGAIYYMILYIHGDLALTESKEEPPCIDNVSDFASCFLFSLETQHTIGYGTRQTTTQCPDAMIVMSLQSVLGCLIQAFMVGLVFSKLSRPRNRSKTIIFSNHAVINMRNRKLCLVIRIGDLRDDNFILGTQISAKLLRRRITAEGEMFQEMQNIKVSPDTTNESCIFFVWPLDIVHVIDKDSPFYDMSAADMARERFELLMVMEGTNEISSMTFQSRSSYLPNEIKWGQRFEQMLLYRKDQNKYQVNFSAFHSMYDVETPLCSARELDRFLQEKRDRKRSNLSVTRGLQQRSTAFLPVLPRKISALTMPTASSNPSLSTCTTKELPRTSPNMLMAEEGLLGLLQVDQHQHPAAKDDVEDAEE